MEALIFGLLLLTSVISLAFIVERGWALRRSQVIPPEVEAAVENCRAEAQLPMLNQICQRHPSTLSRLLQLAISHLDWPKGEMTDMLQTRARHEISHRLERGLVVLEIATGIAPLLGLVGTVYGMIELFASISGAGMITEDPSAKFAQGIALALRATLGGLLIAIPSLTAWSYYNKRVESLAVEMELLCDEFVRHFYTQEGGTSSASAARTATPNTPGGGKAPDATPPQT